MHLAVGAPAMRTAPPAGDARRSTHKRVSEEEEMRGHAGAIEQAAREGGRGPTSPRCAGGNEGQEKQRTLSQCVLGAGNVLCESTDESRQ
jgi:hypothetical protein